MSRPPTHGWNCNFKTRPWRCKCGAPVFFGTCDHGSRIFFDHLGDPWPLHNCGYYAAPLSAKQKQLIELNVKREGDQARRNRALLRNEDFELVPATAISKEVCGIIVRLEESAKLSEILDIPVASLNWGKDIARLTLATMSRWILVEKTKGVDRPKGHEFFMEQSKILGKPVFPGDHLQVFLRGITVVRRPSIWYGEKCWKNRRQRRDNG